MPQQTAHQRSCQRRAGVDVFDEDIGSVPGHYVSQETAAHAGDDAYEHQQEDCGLGHMGVGRADAHYGEDAKARGVHPEHGLVK